VILRKSWAICFELLVALMLCASHSAAQSSGGKSSTTTGAITGRVVNSSGEPLAGASVSVSSVSGNVRGKNATVDDRGDFKVTGLEPGLYSIFASMQGYTANFPAVSNEGPKYYRIGDSVTLTLSKGGVITGAVNGSNGPLIGVGVFATRVRDAAGKKIFTSFPGGYERRTDDRGVFRFWNLAPGAYVLMAMRPRLGTILPSAYDNDVPTFYPSGTRDTAAEVVVREGDEIHADIQYRGEPGHAISGIISGVVSDQLQFGSGPQIYLTEVRDRTQIANAGTSLMNNSVFALYGVPDGEYELGARQFLPTRDELRSAPLRILVRGADVTGLSLTLAPLASIAGRLVFESDAKAGCAKRRDAAAAETMVYARRLQSLNKPAEAKDGDSQIPLAAVNQSWSAVADAKGSFIVRNVFSGDYRIDARPPADGWYLRSITMGPVQKPTAGNTSINPSREVSVRNGERVNGVTVTIAEGAASLRGRVSTSDSLPPRLQVYLVPAEREAADNVYRFYEATVEADGGFTVDNLWPGTYWIVAHRDEENESAPRKLVRQDAALRSKVMQEAGATKKLLILKPCEQLKILDVPAPR
jgi:hypothetical protein